MDALNQAWSEASTKMYQGTGGPTPGAETHSPGAETAAQQSQPESTVEEADYTVVDDEKK
jgi:hypothetical protein